MIHLLNSPAVSGLKALHTLRFDALHIRSEKALIALFRSQGRAIKQIARRHQPGVGALFFQRP